MKFVIGVIAACLLVAGCRGPRPVAATAGQSLSGMPTDPNAWMRVGGPNTPRRVACGELPVLVEGDRNRTQLTGSCGYVRVAGDRNGIMVELAPGGTIEITGAHNDVSWKQANATVPPSLLDRGQSNTFHPSPARR